VSAEYLEKSHIEKCHFNASTLLAEQAIMCLELVSELVKSRLNFQFKGGNSLLLILDTPKRFSIDVDIATDCKREEIEKCLEMCVDKFGVFEYWEPRQHKTKPWIPLASYYLYYKSKFTDDTSAVMLDAQLRRSNYKTSRKAVVCGEIYKNDAMVELPLPSSIIGDKLLTLGPSTLGIPVGKGKEAQRLKHVFDISRLLTVEPALSDIRESFSSCLQQENDIQVAKQSAEAVIEDTLRFCGSIVSYPQIPSGDSLSAIVQENAKGITPFASHLFDPGYDWNMLQIDMAKVALCMTALKESNITDKEFTAMINIKTEKKTLPGTVLKENSTARELWEQIYAVSGSLPF
jgi:Nucleotidyl transferase AbiEii toxin, Type IV TA system